MKKNEDASLYLSVLVIGEIQSGIEKVRTKDTAKANALEQWLITVDKNAFCPSIALWPMNGDGSRSTARCLSWTASRSMNKNRR